MSVSAWLNTPCSLPAASLYSNLLPERIGAVSCASVCVQGIEGHGFYGNCIVPIIENTARECELTDRLRQAIKDYPQANAVLVRRHGEGHACYSKTVAALCWGVAAILPGQCTGALAAVLHDRPSASP